MSSGRVKSKWLASLGLRLSAFFERGFPDAFALALLVVAVAFLASLGILTMLVEFGSLAEVPAQAIAIVAVTPLSFLANKLWSFSR